MSNTPFLPTSLYVGSGKTYEPLFKLEDIERILQPLVETSTITEKDKDKEKGKENKNGSDKTTLITAADAASSSATG